MRLTTRPVAAVAVAAAATGLLVSIGALWHHSAPQLSPDARADVVASSVAPAPRGAEPADRAAPPVRVGVPAIGLDAVVRPVGVDAEGQMQLPANPAVLGWYRFGSSPHAAEGGSVLLAGHVDSRRYGVGPLVRLRDARAGDRVVVGTAGGTRATYVVASVRRYDRQNLPGRLFARAGPERLRLVTCGGGFDPGRGGYQQNLVVTAVPHPRR